MTGIKCVRGCLEFPPRSQRIAFCGFATSPLFLLAIRICSDFVLDAIRTEIRCFASLAMTDRRNPSSALRAPSPLGRRIILFPPRPLGEGWGEGNFLSAMRNWNRVLYVRTCPLYMSSRGVRQHDVVILCLYLKALVTRLGLLHFVRNNKGN